MSNPERHRVLIADDNPNIRTALRATLEAEGFEVLEANDLSKKTRMIVIMSIMGVMFRSLMTSGSSSFRA